MFRTYDLTQAAAILHLHPDTVQRRAKAGLIPGAKPGKFWVFREEALVQYLQELETRNRQASTNQENLCSTDVVKHGGWISSPRPVSALDEVLAQRTKRQHKSITTSPERKVGARRG